MERYLRVTLLGPGPRLIKRIYRTAVSQSLKNTDLEHRLNVRENVASSPAAVIDLFLLQSIQTGSGAQAVNGSMGKGARSSGD